MKDQVDKLNELGIKARLINSTITQIEVQDILNELRNPSINPIKFLYIAPERLNSSLFLNTVNRITSYNVCYTKLLRANIMNI